ncbi:hypothetical protein GCM10009115_15510 [Sphingopyxis soli]|uniref:Peptidase S8/S53 domain-containing protein n=1 Tax=Sphingopyxis soli TaxID=592051 RepID=A0ABN1M3B6_9SPHN|nr:S8 family serine peptidase [Sphingopyxis soli]
MIILGREVVNSLVLGPDADGRLVQDSPVRSDVWAGYAGAPGEALDLLVEAYRDTPTGLVAARIAARLYDTPERPGFGDAGHRLGYGLSFVEGLVAARLRIKELAYSLLPFTRWARSLGLAADDGVAARVEERVARQLHELRRRRGWASATIETPPGIERLAATLRVLASLLWAEGAEAADAAEIGTPADFYRRADIEAIAALAGEIGEHLVRLRPIGLGSDYDIFAVSLNRPVELAIDRSVPAIKGDAAATLFSVNCERLAWAVLDTGIDASHPAFKDLRDPPNSRVVATYDFTQLRRAVLVDHLYNGDILRDNAQFLAESSGLPLGLVIKDLLSLAQDARERRPIDWMRAEKYVLEASPGVPAHPHGTHVAGIIGGGWDAADFAGGAPTAQRGVCPDIRLYDFRVVTGGGGDSEFALVGALQFIRYLNARSYHTEIHGANISLSIRHDVRNYACGRTPVCEEASKLVASGVVVVAAAGNHGFQSYHLSDGGAFESYAPSSITDPGNAEAVITVGATHRTSPHSYGVSFFSSRGPTGDGRQKPDLVAPGEKIWSMIPGPSEDALSGTSMAAPHVSGAAAMLMARNPEFLGRAAEIKAILCESCTDLGRERSFQGAGMLDILRAMQRV